MWILSVFSAIIAIFGKTGSSNSRVGSLQEDKAVLKVLRENTET